MILKFNIEKDTYITNLNTQNIEGINSNFGKSATLDLFKLYNENKHSFSKAFIDFDLSSSINNGTKIFFTDSDLSSLSILFDTNLNYDLSSFNDEETIYTVGIQDKTSNEYTQIIAESINKAADAGKIKINAYNTTKELVLIQQKKGKEGDTEFDISEISNVATSKVEKTDERDYFARIDWSFILVKINFDDLKNIWANNGLTAAFSSGDFSAKLIFKDVSTGLVKPKDYSVVCYELRKEFIEGLGKDTTELSDFYVTNFKKINDLEDWSISGFVSKDNEINSNIIDSFDIIHGDEDVVLDVTSYVEKIISGEIINNYGLLISLSDNDLFNRKSYFVKRLGSKHLLKKSLVPSLDICINDSKYQISLFEINKKSYNVTHDDLEFYIAKNQNRLQDPFIYPRGYDSIKHELTESDGTVIASKNVSSLLTDLRGNEILGVQKSNIDIAGSNILLPKYFEDATANNGKITIKSNWYFSDSNNTLDDQLFKSDGKELIYYNNDSKINKESLYVSIRFDKNLTANNTINKMIVYFIDLKEKVSASRLKYNISSKNIGNVFYKITDKNTGTVLLDVNDNKEKNATKLKYNGECYEANVFISELYKNAVIDIELAFIDYLGNLNFIKNNSTSFKVE
jgi:hypothetical protein